MTGKLTRTCPLDFGAKTLDFVGVESDGGSEFADPDHEGHPGFTAANVAAVIDALNANAADIVLLHIGTNGLDPNGEGDVADILDAIDSWEALNFPVTVFLARIIDQDPINPDVETFNTNVATMADARIASGDLIVKVNQHDALTYPADLSDALHPTLVGYGKMADVWFDALTNSGLICP